MPSPLHIFALSVAALLTICSGCQKISLESEQLGDLIFTKLQTHTGSLGRSSYISTPREDHKTQYLYFSNVNVQEGAGRWILNWDLGANSEATAFVDSWAAEPYHVGQINDGADTSRWHISTETDFVPDFTMGAFCLDDTGDATVYFESSHLSPEIAGFYVTEPISNSSTSVVYSHVKVYESNPALYLYKYENKWMIGETIGGESCLSFVEDDAKTPMDIVSNDWRFVDLASGGEAGWIFDYSSIISKGSFPDLSVDNIHQALREHRSLKSIPDKQQYISLRNNIPMPTMGLGTGGLQEGEQTTQTLTTALGLGYRLFDLAREYNNEKAFADVIRTHEAAGSVYRNEIFIESKVWPTELGYQPTTDAIHTSLELLNSNYIDLYLLHWPVCDPSIDWMHCEDTVDPNGTWRQSWRALERAYAEGRVMSIGVSNFDVNLLNELLDFATVRPHVVQNFAEPGSVDGDVRRWCREHQVLYQPYASIRNLQSLRPELHTALHRIAAERSVSAHSVAIRFFTQSGSGVIPRSTNADHLKENLDSFNYVLSDLEMSELGWPDHTEL